MAEENGSTSSEYQSSPFPFDISLLYRYIVPVLIVLAGASALLNGTILMLHYCVRRPLSTTLKLTFGLAAADLATSTILTFNFIVNSFLPVVYEINVAGACLMIALEALRLGSIFTSILHLLLLTVNHYMAIAYAATYKRKLSSRIVAVLMVAFWALPSLSYLVGFSVVPGRKFMEYIMEYMLRH